MKYLMLSLILVVSPYSYLLAESQDNTDNDQYSCETDYQLVKNQYGVLCIKQAQVSYRSPLLCDSLLNNEKGISLSIDANELKDQCILSKIESSSNKTSLFTAFSPKCQNSYELVIRRGRDACEKRIPEQIKQATKVQ